MLIQTAVMPLLFLVISTSSLTKKDIHNLAEADNSCSTGPSCTINGNHQRPSDFFDDFGEIGDANGNGTATLSLNDLWPCDQYTWLISGTGFTFEDQNGNRSNFIVTSTKQVNIIATGSCGSAKIIVFGCGKYREGYMRSSRGDWVLVHECDVDAADDVYVHEAVKGAYRFIDDWCHKDCEPDGCCLGSCPARTEFEDGHHVEASWTYMWVCE